MPKLVIEQNNIEYYGIFQEPALDFIGDLRALLKLLYGTFSNYGIGLSSFRVEGDAQEVAGLSVNVRLGVRGIYKFKFDHVVVTLSEFNSEQLAGFFETIQLAEEHLRGAISKLSFKTHAFFYTSHSKLSEGTATEFFRGLPSRDIPVYGEDLGSGVLQAWRDTSNDARCSLSVDHSAQVKDGIYVAYRVVIDRDQVDYIPLAVTAQQNLYKALASMDLEFDEEVETS